MKVPDSHPNLPELESRILKWWEDQNILPQYLNKNEKSEKRYRFLDGPITANNPMGVHHAHGRTIKDFFQRYKNMQGFKQRFQNGFDCQGLWVEVEVEKDLGFDSKRDIENFGLEKFSLACIDRVNKFSQVQANQSKRLGMFMDWENSYYTMSENNNLHIWHFLKKIEEKGWLYKGTDAMPWCTRCGTAISQHEISDGGYKEVTHNSLYVKFRLLNTENTYLLIWTTTPWTLMSNVAVAVHPELDYRYWILEDGSKVITLDPSVLDKSAKTQLMKVLNLPDAENNQGEVVKGKDLVGLKYEGLYDNLDAIQKVQQKNPEKFHTVIPAPDLVDPNEGTGLIHIAPGAGKEDFELGKEHNLPIISSIDEFGLYLEGFGEYTGRFVLDVNKQVIQDLQEINPNPVVQVRPIVHMYPHCWRCKHELVFRTTSEWFIKADEIRPLMKAAAEKVNWLPDFAGKRMQDWLDNMGDWPISRKRYWGLALPFYESEDGSEYYVVESKEELKKLALEPDKVDQLKELHRPWIDEIKIKSPKTGQTLTRVKDVGDCWLDAGIVPFSTVNYLTDPDYWKQWYPFEFVTEYVAQVKLWFYATLFMSVTLQGRAPWENVLATGFLVDEKGDAMHKSRGNAIPFDEAAEKAGADAIRWLYLRERVANHHGTGNLRFGYNILDDVRRRFLVILWNTYRFFVQNAELDHWNQNAWQEDFVSTSVLDKWIVSKFNSILKEVSESLDKFDSPTAVAMIEKFIVNDFSQWYVRRSRDRVGPSAADEKDKEQFYQTGYTILLNLTKLLAPFIPFVTEEIYQTIRRSSDPDSIHLTDWPQALDKLIDLQLEAEMTQLREDVESVHSLRKQHGLALRQPLRSATIRPFKGANADLLKDLIKDEVNVQEIHYAEDEKIQIDVNIDEELRIIGLGRELNRKVQDLRKTANYNLDQKIEIFLESESEMIEKIVASNRDEMQRKLLAVNIHLNTHSSEGSISETIDLDGKPVKITLQPS